MSAIGYAHRAGIDVGQQVLALVPGTKLQSGAYAVAPVALGPSQCIVGRLENPRRVGAMLRKGGDADRDGHTLDRPSIADDG